MTATTPPAMPPAMAPVDELPDEEGTGTGVDGGGLGVEAVELDGWIPPRLTLDTSNPASVIQPQAGSKASKVLHLFRNKWERRGGVPQK